MNVSDLIPWGRTSAPTPVMHTGADDPFMSLHREVNRLFDDAFRGFGLPTDATARWPARWPSIEIAETDKDIRISAEVPGLDEKDVEVLLEDGVLTIRGEKKSATGGKDRQFTEHYYGRFERRMAIGADVDQDKVQAAFKNGVLEVTLPKTETARSRSKRIPISAR